MTQTIDTLNNRFGLAGLLHFVDSGSGLPVAEIQTAHASARVALQGAHVLTWQPAGQAPVLWVSKATVYEPGKAVRGGVPVCWPWFGSVAGLPAHGFVRTRVWQLRDARQDDTGQVVLRLATADDTDTRALWDFAFDLELVVTVGQTLTMALVTKNTGTTPFTLTEALHSYFDIGDITQTTVRGLDGCAYLDKVQNFALAKQRGAVAFAGETDRIYIDTTADCLIDDKARGRTLRVAKQGSTSTVVWNPWSERAKAMTDMAPAEFKDMLCVETCNAGPDQITLVPGQQHTLTATISVA